MKVIKKLLLLVLGAFAGMMCLGGVLTLTDFLQDTDFQQGKTVVIIMFLLMIAGFGFTAFSCFKDIFSKGRMPKKEELINFPAEEMQMPEPTPEPSPVVKVNIVRQEVPQETLNNMRMAYTGQQAVNDIRIVDESLAIMEKTSDIDTFLQRYETAMKCALTLEQAKKAGIAIALSDGFSQSLVDIKEKALSDVLYRSFKKELDEINQLKTDKGKLNRINKYQEKLQGMYEDVFEFVADEAYGDIMQKLEQLKKEMGSGQDAEGIKDIIAEAKVVQEKCSDVKYPKCNCDGCPKQDNCEYGHVIYDEITKKRMSLFDKFMMLHTFDCSVSPEDFGNVAANKELHDKRLLLELGKNVLYNTLNYLQEVKKVYLAFGKCGRAYFNFMKMGDEISLVKEAVREYDEYQAILKQQNLVKSYVLDRAYKEGEFKQEEIYKNFPDVERKNVTSAVRELEKSKCIIREKNGKTYIIRKNNT